MKKLLVLAQSSVGGAERMSVTVTRTLDRSAYHVIYYLIGPAEEKAPLEEFIPEDLEVHHVTKQNPLYLIAKFLLILMKEKPDIVFSSVLNLNNKLLLLRSLFRKTKFIVRCDNYLYTYNEKQRQIIDRTYHNADMIIAQTEEMKQELLDDMCIFDSKVTVLQNPVDRETIDRKIKYGNNPYPYDGKIRYVATGRFDLQKGFDLLIRAFVEVKQKQPSAELYIVGKKDGICEDYYKEQKTLIDIYGIQDSVKCVGFQTNPYVYIKYADCFVLSSRWEGLPNVMIEALYLGTPVAAFKCVPIIERIITETKDGFLAEKEDIDGLAKAMIMASKLGRVKSMYKSASIDDFHQIFDSVLNAHKK